MEALYRLAAPMTQRWGRDNEERTAVAAKAQAAYALARKLTEQVEAMQARIMQLEDVISELKPPRRRAA